jgi:multidrug efflux pump subunit AcrB
MGVTAPMIKPKSIDDVPILALTFHSSRYDHLTLRRVAAQVDEEVKAVPLVAETNLIGGTRRQVRVQLDPVKLAARNLSPAGLVPMLQQANRQFRAGGLTTGNSEVLVAWRPIGEPFLANLSTPLGFLPRRARGGGRGGAYQQPVGPDPPGVAA